MPRGLNKVMLIGEVGRDPEMRYTPGGKPVTTFSVSTNRSWVDPDGQHREATEWFNIVAWRRLAEICNERLGRGARVYVEGRLQTRTWHDQEGHQHYRTEVVASEMIKLDGSGIDQHPARPAIDDVDDDGAHADEH